MDEVCNMHGEDEKCIPEGELGICDRKIMKWYGNVVTEFDSARGWWRAPVNTVMNFRVP
jgi:hypothetical protein